MLWGTSLLNTAHTHSATAQGEHRDPAASTLLLPPHMGKPGASTATAAR